MTLKRMVLLMTLAAMLAAMPLVASGVPAAAQGFDTSNWKPSYLPYWCYDPYYKAAVAQYVGWDQVNEDCAPGPVVR